MTSSNVTGTCQRCDRRRIVCRIWLIMCCNMPASSGRRNRNRLVKMPMKELMQQTTERLPQRVRQAGMELHETLAPQAAKTVVLTDPAAVEQILFNLVDNSCKYASRAEDRRIHLHWSVGKGVAQIRATDHGPGIQAAQAKKLFRPFSKSDLEAAQTAPGIGLGLALCRRLAGEIGGKLHFDSGNGDGAAFPALGEIVRRRVAEGARLSGEVGPTFASSDPRRAQLPCDGVWRRHSVTPKGCRSRSARPTGDLSGALAGPATANAADNRDRVPAPGRAAPTTTRRSSSSIGPSATKSTLVQDH